MCPPVFLWKCFIGKAIPEDGCSHTPVLRDDKMQFPPSVLTALEGASPCARAEDGLLSSQEAPAVYLDQCLIQLVNAHPLWSLLNNFHASFQAGNWMVTQAAEERQFLLSWAGRNDVS
ncbi:hypothetical protein P7K49_028566 [Saguinus oedipus]|uniref:Uncharacterized protein n=1 Tax=Saguinus oedipus TaxID=9490 RepID=A0ABQ9U4P4_SAGOE|nr:hypothetical protein P7K49_028566 [Saguinus oedipus]